MGKPLPKVFRRWDGSCTAGLGWQYNCHPNDAIPGWNPADTLRRVTRQSEGLKLIWASGNAVAMIPRRWHAENRCTDTQVSSVSASF
jgi:hypothetical protein